MLGPVLMTILESSKLVASVFRNSTMLWRDEPPLLEDPALFSLLSATDALALASPLAFWSADFLSFFWWTDSRNAVTPPFLDIEKQCWIRDAYPGSRIQGQKDSGSRIRIKEFKYFLPKKLFLSFRKYDPGCSSRIRILVFYPSRIQGVNGSWIRIRNTEK